MKTVVTSKYQTIIPKKVREKLHLSIRDVLDWHVEHGKIIVSPIQKKFLSFQNSIKTGPGNIQKDIELARKLRAERYK